MKLSETLKDLRQSENLSQKELSQKLQIGQSTITQYENEQREPTLYNLTKYAKFFNVSLDYLAGLEDDFGVRTSTPIGDDMTADEREMIKKIRLLPKESRNLIVQMIDTLSGTSASSVNKKQA